MERKDKTTPMISGDEYDYLTRCSRRVYGSSSVGRYIKRGFNKRVRQKVEQELMRELDAFMDED